MASRLVCYLYLHSYKMRHIGMYSTVWYIKMFVLLDIFVLNGVQIGNRKDVVLQKDRNWIL